MKERLMKGKILAAGAVFVLTGCAAVYNESAIPRAQENLSLAREQCTARRLGGDLKGAPNIVNVECFLAADLAFAKEIQLKDMALYETYAARVRLLAKERDAGLVTLEQANQQSQAIWRDYIGGIQQAAAYDAARRAKLAAALAVMGQSMQRAAAQAQAEQAAYEASHPSFNCNSLAVGNTVQTHCN